MANASPEKRTAKEEFFHRAKNLFESLDAAHRPQIEEGDDELETSVHSHSRMSRVLITGLAIQGAQAGCSVADV